MSGPRIQVVNRQRSIAISIPKLRELAPRACSECLRAAEADSPLARLSAIEVILLSDTAIRRVHYEFFRDAEPTDVITFDHGEIVLGAGMVARHALEHEEIREREALRCIVHGLLHLGGWDDRTSALRRRMFARQEAIVARLWPKRRLDTSANRS